MMYLEARSGEELRLRNCRAKMAKIAALSIGTVQSYVEISIAGLARASAKESCKQAFEEEFADRYSCCVHKLPASTKRICFNVF